jgi:hypothetical protein
VGPPGRWAGGRALDDDGLDQLATPEQLDRGGVGAGQQPLAINSRVLNTTRVTSTCRSGATVGRVRGRWCGGFAARPLSAPSAGPGTLRPRRRPVRLHLHPLSSSSVNWLPEQPAHSGGSSCDPSRPTWILHEATGHPAPTAESLLIDHPRLPEAAATATAGRPEGRTPRRVVPSVANPCFPCSW